MDIANGIEPVYLPKDTGLPGAGLAYYAELGVHTKLTQVILADQTDIHNELVFEKEWLLHPAEARIELAGNLFFTEDTLSGSGVIFLIEAPLPHARPEVALHDLLVLGGRHLGLYPGRYRWAAIPYSGGRYGRTRALHRYQRQKRLYNPRIDGLFLSNTWGDRSRDSRINEDFMIREIEAAARLGVDIVQIDDGWQKGRTSNSVQTGGVWEGFWAADEHFWAPHPDRFPRGLGPLVEHAERFGVGVGLWFAPDSANDFGNWNKDAEAVANLYRDYGIKHLKIDGVKAGTPDAAANLARFFDSAIALTSGDIAFDLDVTAQVRPGYFGSIGTGPLFVENRYTDWHRYWPHHTLRNLWKLSRYIDPLRLRIEWLNNKRNTELYAGDPLAPASYSPDYLFASVMFASPLGWFEVSNLPDDYFGRAADLVRIWKSHREEIFSKEIIPIGDMPDGTTWTGFIAGRYFLVFRELAAAGSWEFRLPDQADGVEDAVILFGDRGTADLIDDGTCLKVALEKPLSFIFGRLI